MAPEGSSSTLNMAMMSSNKTPCKLYNDVPFNGSLGKLAWSNGNNSIASCPMSKTGCTGKAAYIVNVVSFQYNIISTCSKCSVNIILFLMVMAIFVAASWRWLCIVNEILMVPKGQWQFFVHDLLTASNDWQHICFDNLDMSNNEDDLSSGAHASETVFLPVCNSLYIGR